MHFPLVVVLHTPLQHWPSSVQLLAVWEQAGATHVPAVQVPMQHGVLVLHAAPVAAHVATHLPAVQVPLQHEVPEVHAVPPSSQV